MQILDTDRLIRRKQNALRPYDPAVQFLPTFPEHDEHHETSWRCFYYSQHRLLPVPNNESKTVTETNRGRWRQAVANVTANLKAG